MGQHLSKVPLAFQNGIEHENSWNVSGITSIAFDSQADKFSKYILKHIACTVTFFGFLLLLSWYYGRSNFERWDPVQAANEERDAAIEQRDDAQRTWQKTESKYEKTLATNLQLRSEISKTSKDLPWLEQRVSALVEETNLQQHAIEGLEAIKRKYEKLSKEVNDYGLSAERPEYQKRYEEAKRMLDLTNNHLQNSQYYAKGLEEKLQTQLEKPNAEIKWLRARLRSNARSTAYWARYRQHADNPEFKPAWGVRCACTEPDIGYSLKDQGPRIVDLEDTVARLLGKVLNTPDVAETKVRVKAEEELSAKDTVIKELREEVTARKQTINGLLDEKVTASDELAASRQKINEIRGEKEAADRTATTTISDLNHTLSESRKDLADARQEYADVQRELGQQKAMVEELRNDIAGKEVEIGQLESANQEMAEQPSLESTENVRLLTIANTNLNDSRRENAECQKQCETQTAKIAEWEAAGREFDARVEAKDDRIAKLEEKINEQSETHTSKFGEWEAAGREFNARVEAKDDKITDLEQQIYKKDKDYRELFDHYNIVLGERKYVVDKYNGDLQTFKTMQKGYFDREHELQHQWTEYSRSHVNCGGQITTLTNQVREGANAHGNLQNTLTCLRNTHTDLQTKHNAQAEELDVANQNVRELRDQLAECSSSEINFEKYRIEGENRARQIWQANATQETSDQKLRLEESERKVVKLENQLRQAKNQTNPLQEMLLKEREIAVKAKEEALEKSTDPMDHDQQGSHSGGLEIEDLERRLAAANQEINNAKNRNRAISGQLNTEKKERSEEKARHEKLLKQEQESAKTKCDVLRITLEKENPLKGIVSKLQDEIIKLRGEAEKRN